MYYDGTKLLSMRDINGKKPEIFLCTTNRTGGKTTYFNRLEVNRFLKNKSKFMLLYRYKYELDNVGEKFFKDIGELFFNGYNVTTIKKGKGVFMELFLSKGESTPVSMGYAVALNTADQIKKLSHLFSDVESILFDEFQSETNSYCDKEIQKFISIHTSVARGQGKQVRYVPVYMLSNAVTLINPYYNALGISSRLKNETKFLKGDGFVLEQGFVESASKAQAESGFNRAFASNEYVAYSSQNCYLNDNTAFIEKPQGNGRYLATVRYNGNNYGIKEFADLGIIYFDSKADSSFPLKISVSTNDHDVNYVMLKRNEIFITQLRYFFEHGCLRFKDLNSKECAMKLISY